MKHAEFFKLRTKLNKAIGEVLTAAESESDATTHEHLSQAYSQGCEMLEVIDILGASLGYLDDETNEELIDLD